MEFLVLVAVFLCTCAVIHYRRFLGRPKLLPWLSSLLPAAASPELVEKQQAAEEEEEDDDGDSSIEDDGERELERIFSTFDKDGDGFITAGELEESLRRLGLAVTAEETAAMVDRVDANGDGLIDLQEFRQLCAEMMLQGEAAAGEDDENLREAFGVFDGNGDGLITAEELAKALTSLGMKQGAMLDDCREMIKKVDRDGDGKVDFGEFTKMMKTKGGKKLF
ncbi:calmodulin-like protein 6 [Curcuma longa]|uniref:calmodulin-like protein 6 n=1 Tax=Curcuma longa TaxID=136217 RepID=UPI003D9F88EC